MSYLITRRRLLKTGLTVAVTPLLASQAAPAIAVGALLVNPAEPAAKAVKYVEDAKLAAGATAGATCANCALYLGASGSAQGPCQIFSGKQVKAAGWCSSWAPQM